VRLKGKFGDGKRAGQEAGFFIYQLLGGKRRHQQHMELEY